MTGVLAKYVACTVNVWVDSWRAAVGMAGDW